MGGIFSSTAEAFPGATAPRVSNTLSKNVESPKPINTKNSINANLKNINNTATNVVVKNIPPRPSNTPVNVNKEEREMNAQRKAELEEGEIDIIEGNDSIVPPVKLNVANNQSGGKRTKKQKKAHHKKSKSRKHGSRKH